MKKAELVLFPAPVAGHLFSMVEAAKIIVDRDDRLSITVLIMQNPFDPIINNQISSLAASTASSRLGFVELPNVEHNPNDTSVHPFVQSIEIQKPHVKDALSKLIARSESTRLAGFVVDMSCTVMIDVANDFGVPSYAFCTSGAAFLGFRLHMLDFDDVQKVGPTELKDSDVEFPVPSLASPLPAKFLPGAVLNKDWFNVIFRSARLSEIKGIMVNTFVELESHAVNSLSDTKFPPVYSVGPILNLKGQNNSDHQRSDGNRECRDIMGWLDDQRQSSVVFLCFGSMGSFGADQVKEIARALERSGHPFLWSLRKPPPKSKMEFPGDYLNPQEALPEGFLDRTAGIGKVIGWAPQMAILAHPAIGGFVSHCGWNSMLESLWFGVPIATWPMYAEQQFNAFLLVRELGLAAEIKMDYRRDFIFTPKIQDFVGAEEIERGIGRVMEHNSEIRDKVKKMSALSREALLDGGSSHSSFGRFIRDVIDNMP